MLGRAGQGRAGHGSLSGTYSAIVPPTISLADFIMKGSAQ